MKSLHWGHWGCKDLLASRALDRIAASPRSITESPETSTEEDPNYSTGRERKVAEAEKIPKKMDPRTALLQQESDESKGFRNKSIGMHNLRAKLREQLKGYSHVRGESIFQTIVALGTWMF